MQPMRAFQRIAPRAPRFAPVPICRPFSSVPARRLKEDKKQDPEEVEKAKQKQMKDGKSREELESSSESHIKADQEHVKDHDAHMEKLQKETAQKKEEEHPQGKS